MRLLCLIGAFVLGGCGFESTLTEPSHADDAGSGATTGTLAEPDRLHVDEQFFRDGLGRAVILRGVNARVEGLFDVTFDDGRIALENVPTLETKDCKRMAELGLRLVRLPLSWSGIEPKKDNFDERYLERVDAAVRCFRDQGIYTLLDVHQDAYSKEIGEDGAPLWAIIPEPTMLLEGPLGDSLPTRRISKQVFAAFESFFINGDEHDLQAQYIEMLEHVAERYADDEWVLGIDLFNEPVTGSALLAAFNARAGAAVRAVAPKMLVAFEPTALWDALGGEPVGGKKMPVKGAVFAPHIYDLVVGGTTQDLADVTRADIEPSFRTAKAEAEDWGTPWMLGEFGAGPSVTNYEKYLTLFYELQDEYLVSSTLWLWKEDSQGKWGLFDGENGAWVERESMVKLVSRPHAVRISGTPTSMRFTEEQLVVAYEDAFEAASVLFIPERFDVGTVRCDGESVDAERDGTGRIEVSCGKKGAHEISVGLK